MIKTLQKKYPTIAEYVPFLNVCTKVVNAGVSKRSKQEFVANIMDKIKRDFNFCTLNKIKGFSDTMLALYCPKKDLEECKNSCAICITENLIEKGNFIGEGVGGVVNAIRNFDSILVKTISLDPNHNWFRNEQANFVAELFISLRITKFLIDHESDEQRFKYLVPTLGYVCTKDGLPEAMVMERVPTFKWGSWDKDNIIDMSTTDKGQIMLQAILATLEMSELLGLNHMDFHTQNIIVSKHSQTLRYVINGRAFSMDVKYTVRIIDWGKASIGFHTRYGQTDLKAENENLSAINEPFIDIMRFVYNIFRRTAGYKDEYYKMTKSVVTTFKDLCPKWTLDVQSDDGFDHFMKFVDRPNDNTESKTWKTDRKIYSKRDMMYYLRTCIKSNESFATLLVKKFNKKWKTKVQIFVTEKEYKEMVGVIKNDFLASYEIGAAIGESMKKIPDLNKWTKYRFDAYKYRIPFKGLEFVAERLLLMKKQFNMCTTKTGAYLYCPKNLNQKDCKTLCDTGELNCIVQNRLTIGKFIKKGVYGSANYATVNTFQSNTIVVKTEIASKPDPRNKATFINEALVGFVLNEFIDTTEIPNFIYTYGLVCNKLDSPMQLVIQAVTNYTNQTQLPGFMDRIAKISNNDECVEIIAQVILALAMAEEQTGFCHNDLHEENMLIQKAPTRLNYAYIVRGYKYNVRSAYTVRILDFGLAAINTGLDRFGNNSVSGYFCANFQEILIDYARFALSLNRYEKSSNPQKKFLAQLMHSIWNDLANLLPAHTDWSEKFFRNNADINKGKGDGPNDGFGALMVYTLREDFHKKHITNKIIIQTIFMTMQNNYSGQNIHAVRIPDKDRKDVDSLRNIQQKLQDEYDLKHKIPTATADKPRPQNTPKQSKKPTQPQPTKIQSNKKPAEPTKKPDQPQPTKTQSKKKPALPQPTKKQSNKKPTKKPAQQNQPTSPRKRKPLTGLLLNADMTKNRKRIPKVSNNVSAKSSSAKPKNTIQQNVPLAAKDIQQDVPLTAMDIGEVYSILYPAAPIDPANLLHYSPNDPSYSPTSPSFSGNGQIDTSEPRFTPTAPSFSGNGQIDTSEPSYTPTAPSFSGNGQIDTSEPRITPTKPSFSGNGQNDTSTPGSGTPAPVPVPAPVPKPVPISDPVTDPAPASDPAPVPVPAPVLTPVAVPKPVPISDPVPFPIPTPDPVPVPVPAPVLTPVAVPKPVPISDPVPFPIPTPDPVPVPVPDPVPVPVPVHTPAPVRVPVPAPVLTPVAVPKPVPISDSVTDPAPASDPAPVPVPAPVLTPVAVPKPVPISDPVPFPIPTPDPVPVPVPDPFPVPVPVHTPAPVRVPVPDRVPDPIPVPVAIHDHASSPASGSASASSPASSPASSSASASALDPAPVPAPAPAPALGAVPVPVPAPAPAPALDLSPAPALALALSPALALALSTVIAPAHAPAPATAPGVDDSGEPDDSAPVPTSAPGADDSGDREDFDDSGDPDDAVPGADDSGDFDDFDDFGDPDDDDPGDSDDAVPDDDDSDDSDDSNVSDVSDKYNEKLNKITLDQMGRQIPGIDTKTRLLGKALRAALPLEFAHTPFSEMKMSLYHFANTHMFSLELPEKRIDNNLFSLDDDFNELVLPIYREKNDIIKPKGLTDQQKKRYTVVASDDATERKQKRIDREKILSKNTRKAKEQRLEVNKSYYQQQEILKYRQELFPVPELNYDAPLSLNARWNQKAPSALQNTVIVNKFLKASRTDSVQILISTPASFHPHVYELKPTDTYTLGDCNANIQAVFNEKPTTRFLLIHDSGTCGDLWPYFQQYDGLLLIIVVSVNGANFYSKCYVGHPVGDLPVIPDNVSSRVLKHIMRMANRSNVLLDRKLLETYVDKGVIALDITQQTLVSMLKKRQDNLDLTSEYVMDDNVQAPKLLPPIILTLDHRMQLCQKPPYELRILAEPEQARIEMEDPHLSMETTNVSGEKLLLGTSGLKIMNYVPAENKFGEWLKNFIMSTKRSLWVQGEQTLMELIRCSTTPIPFYPELDATFVNHVVMAFTAPGEMTDVANLGVAELLQTRLHELGITMRVYENIDNTATYTLVEP
jgi:hypothetical protein